jgi:hypothetical protein
MNALRKDNFSISIGTQVVCVDDNNNSRLKAGVIYKVTGVSVMSRYIKVMVGTRSGIYLRDRFALLLSSVD